MFLLKHWLAGWLIGYQVLRLIVFRTFVTIKWGCYAFVQVFGDHFKQKASWLCKAVGGALGDIDEQCIKTFE